MKIKSNFLGTGTIYKGRCMCGFFSLLPFHSHNAFPDFFALQHPLEWHILSILWVVLMFCPFKHVIWFSDVPLLFSICFLVMLSFGGNFSLGPQRFIPGVALSLFFFLNSCFEMFVMWPNSSSAWVVEAPVLFSLQSCLSISSCRAHLCAFRIPVDSIREQFLKANEEKKPTVMF